MSELRGVSQPAPSRASIIAAFAAIYVFWGASFLALRYAVADIPPLLTIALRCAGGATILFTWLAVRRTLESPTRAQVLTAAAAGTCLFLGCHALLAWAEQRVPSGQAALLLTATPLWMVLLSAVRERRLPTPRIAAGLALGCLGVGIVASPARLQAQQGTTADRAALIVSALFWAVGSLIGRHGPRTRSAAQSTATQLASGAVVLLLASAARGELAAWSPTQITPRGAISLIFLIVCATVLGFAAYTWLLRITTPGAVGSFAFVNPIVALGLAWALGDGPMTARTVLAAVVVVSAVALTRDKPSAAASVRMSKDMPAGVLGTSGDAGPPSERTSAHRGSRTPLRPTTAPVDTTRT